MNIKVINASEKNEIKKRLLNREQTDYNGIQAVVNEIIHNIKRHGDEALFSYTKEFDNFDITSGNIEITEDEIEAALLKTDPELIEVMKIAAENIKKFHDNQKREDWNIDAGDGAVIGQKYIPVERAGVYVPGGKAAYPSSVLMNIIPAKSAGVGEIIAVTPARDGKVNPATLAAAHIAGADRIFKIGGAQAIAALAYGTETVPKADVIVGPGNIYVALAKKSVFGDVGLDMIAGPSEILIIADKKANPKYVAADLLSQSEHDELAAGILVTDSDELIKAVNEEITKQLESLSRRGIIEKSLEKFGTAILCEDKEECIRIANLIAPEHLEICTSEPEKILPEIRNAGSVFLGNYSPEPLGDYFAGTNHVLPTNGNARFSSPLNVDDFQKKSSVIYYTKEAFNKAGEKIEKFALSEGLDAHANSVAVRFEKE